MAKKLEKGEFPQGHGPDDFKAFGPPALEDGNFEHCKIADMGSFSQDEKDSNKFYFAMVTQSRKTQKWYAYFEWGRVGASKPQFQFVECNSEADAQAEFAEQCHAKNDKRGVWTTVAGIRTLAAKPKKDVYLVRQLTTRSTGLPDAKTIKYVDPNTKKKDDPAAKPKKSNGSARKADPVTSRLLQDLIGGTIKYTRSAMADDSLPTQTSIDQARVIITEAQKRLAVIGGTLDDQIKDKELRTFSGELYRRIPKVKRVGTPDAEWILSQANIFAWNQDLDAFESALTGQVSIEEETDHDAFHGLPLHMEWIDPNSPLGKFLVFWWPKASANRHSGIGNMVIRNLWRVERNGDWDRFRNAQKKIVIEKPKISERPLFQPSERHDLTPEIAKDFIDSNTALLFHGSRTVNLSGILRTGLRFPHELVGVTITGAAYGPGAYFADDWRKSAGYTSLRGSYWSGGAGGVGGRHAFMFAGDVVCGQPYVAPKMAGFTKPPSGHHCIFGMGKVHGKKTNSGVENNEWVIFEKDQINLRYLVEFST